MILKIEKTEEFYDWNREDLFSVRIMALLKSYGLKYNFATFYKQVVDDKVVAIISRLDNDFTISATDDINCDELVRFFCVTGFSSILSSDKFNFGAKYEEGAIMECRKKHCDPLPLNTSVDEYPKLMDLYNFVDYEGLDFKSWYVDISHRVRHNTAKAYTLCLGDTIISSGILSSIIGGDAVLTAVRTDDEFRRMGYGSALVKYICSDVKGTVYIMRDKELNESFYKKLGFENTGIWRIYR